MNAILQFPFEIKLQKLVPLLFLFTIDQESAINLAFTPSLSLLANIKQNRLSLKSLEQKLSKLEKSSNTDSHRKDENSNNKDSENIIVRIRKGSAPMLLILSTVLTYANKIPFINRVTAYIAKRYAKQSWLQLLIYLRKWFIVFNAIIGLVTVFKVTGYSSDNMIAGLYGLGTTYVDMFTSFVKRAFNYLFELFDHKVVPNVPNNPPSNNSWYRWGPKQNTWYDRNMVKDGMSKIVDLSQNQDFYKGPFSNNTGSSTSWTWSSLFYYGGIAILSIGVLYIGYNLYYEPSYIYKLLGIDYKGKGRGPSGPGPSAPNVEVFNAEDIEEGVESGVASKIGAAIMGFNRGLSRALNPFNYLPANNVNGMTESEFLVKQANHHTSINTLYPFTSNNPYDSIWTKLRIAILGENLYEADIRKMSVNAYHKDMDRLLRPGIQIDTVSGRVTPITSMGIPVTMTSNSVYDINSVAQISSKLNSGWNTPIPSSSTVDATTLSYKLSTLPVQEDVNAWSSGIDVADRNVDNVNITNLLNRIDSDNAITIAEAQSKIDSARLEEFSKLIDPANPNDFTKVRHFVDSVFIEVKGIPGENSHTWPQLFKDRLKLMNPEWLRLAYPDQFEGATYPSPLDVLSESFHLTTMINVSPDVSSLNQPKNFCKDLIIRCIKDRYSLDTRIHLIKSLDISVLKTAFPNYPDITTAQFLLEPAKYLGKKWAKFLPDNNKYGVLDEVNI